MSQKIVIAVDVGGESGRVMRIGFDGSQLTLERSHHFPNIPVQVGDTLYWDILRLWHEVLAGIDQEIDGAASVGIDTWGNDFALLDRENNLLANPVHYRDHRTDGMPEWVWERVPRRVLFERTGIQFMQLNALYQMASLVRANSPLLDAATLFLTIPDLFNYWLTGTRACEFTNATTTQCFNPVTCGWDTDTLAELGIPADIFPETIQPGTQIGTYEATPVIVPACHDTGSAVVAVPTTAPDFAYLSSGTWSLFGLEVREPIITDAAFEANVTNEGGVYGTFRLLKNVMGLWLAQDCQHTWQREGADYSYDELVHWAGEAEAFRSFVDPDAPPFIHTGDMPGRIRDFCRHTGQPVPETVAQVMRTVFESLAMKYRFVLDKLTTLTGRTVAQVHVIGGGSQNALLNQMTANACQRPVIAGPAEATALGNGIVQLISLGDLADVAEARALLSRSFDLTTYTPQHTAMWEAEYRRFLSVTGLDS